MDIITDLSTIIKRGRIQGIGNKEITPEIVSKIGGSVGSFLGAKGIMVVAREFNNNNRMLKRGFISGLMSTGVNILNLHSAPVPVLQFCIRRFGAESGVYFGNGSASDGIVQIRFFDSSGIEYDKSNLESVNEYFKNNKIERANPWNVGAISDIPHTQDIYKKAIPQFINRKLLNSKNLVVVVDCSYGPSSIVVPSILTELKNDCIAINAYENDQKANEMYPNLRSIKDVVNIVKASHAHLGIVLDSDGSRALYIDETGYILTYEELMMLFLKYDKELSTAANGSSIIISKSSSKVLEQFAIDLNDLKILKSKNFPGEISRSLREERAILGGSDTYKFYFPKYGPFSDATFTTLKILEILASQDLPLSVLIRSFPRSVHSYKTIPISKENILHFVSKLKDYIGKKDIGLEKNIDFQDLLIGIKIIVKDLGWVVISPSVHVNNIELTAEGLDPHKSEELISLATECVEKCQK
ncbi:hypothetical protein DSAG12_01504 [Promethearchaeum syntrophicum]|uniref:Uncharacterized protein n=1 Tax=Promethearchaeum syntrophicum TaxID=2594042 RepID=A0A5B9DA10_9ARCH|nr:hypothetical protein [Candidatus Prometheoarchaeum syntrophicum]QEE15677.1 putative phosphoglucosamine mutase [Candidatus Prometheoarchaeum syntrophicum]